MRRHDEDRVDRERFSIRGLAGKAADAGKAAGGAAADAGKAVGGAAAGAGKAVGGAAAGAGKAVGGAAASAAKGVGGVFRGVFGFLGRLLGNIKLVISLVCACFLLIYVGPVLMTLWRGASAAARLSRAAAASLAAPPVSDYGYAPPVSDYGYAAASAARPGAQIPMSGAV